MSNASPYDLDKWERHAEKFFRHKDTGKIIHEHEYEVRKQKHSVLVTTDVTANKEIRAFIEEARKRASEHQNNECQLEMEFFANKLEELIDE